MRSGFMKDQRISINEREYLIEGRLPGGKVALKDICTNNSLVRPMNDLVKELFDGNLKMLDSSSYTERKAANVLEADFTQLPEELRKEAKRKYAYVKKLIEGRKESLSKNSLRPLIEEAAREIGDINPPSEITLYRWHRDYITSGEDIRALVPRQKQKGNRKTRISSEVEDAIDKAIASRYLTMERLSVPAVYSAVVTNIADSNRFRDIENKLGIPDITTVRRRIAQLDPYETAKARFGKKIADARFKALKQGVITSRPLERVELDHTKLDLFVIDTERGMPIGRPWLTSAIDVYTKSVFGIYLSFNPPSYLSVMQCLLHGITPKAYVKEKYPKIKKTWDTFGIPETVIVDNGKEFHSTHFEDACLQLGIEIQYSPVKLPWYRPSVERYFGTLNKELLHQQPGTSFSNIMEKGDYNPFKNAVIDFKTLLEIVHKWVIDVYHQKEHKGISNIPALLWKTAIEEFPPALPPRRSELEVLLGMIEERTISPSGIELHGLFYNSDELAALRGGISAKVTVKFDPTDISMVYVFDRFKGNFIPVPALNQSYAEGLSLWQHSVIKAYTRKYIKENIDIASLCRAKEEIREIVASAWAQTKKNITRQKMMRFKSSSRMITGDAMEKEKADAIPLEAGRRLIPLYAGEGAMAGISDAGSFDNSEEGIKGGVVVLLEKKRKNGKKPEDRKNHKQKDEAEGAGNKAASHSEDEDLDMSGWSADYDRPEAKQ